MEFKTNASNIDETFMVTTTHFNLNPNCTELIHNDTVCNETKSTVDASNSTSGIHTPAYNIIQDQSIQALFCILYTTIFILGVFGNVLVCYVVGRNRGMHTVTNFFITNLALSDILLCVLAVPFTPLYSFLGQWVFGSELCHLVACAQGTSVYISTLTLTSIAIDRFIVIIYPFKQRMQLTTCFIIICSIWLFSLMVTLPYGIYISHKFIEGRFYCEESWPTENFRQVYGSLTASMQFLLPFLIIAFCYVKVSFKLNDRARSKPGAKNSRKEEADRERKRRTNRMLIAMVAIFGGSWLPLNAVNVLNDVYIPIGTWKYYNLCFFMVHAIAMSSTCYNPFLYAWLNENFRKEFKQVLPCFDPSASRSSGSGSQGRTGWRSERTCNGNETMQETLLHTSVTRRGSVRMNTPDTCREEDTQQSDDQKAPVVVVLDGKCKAVKEDSVDVETVILPVATYSAEDESVHLRLAPEDGKTSPPAYRPASLDSRPNLPLAIVLGDSL